MHMTTDAAELASRRAYFEITDDDLALLSSLRPVAERHGGAAFGAHRDAFLGLFAGRCDVPWVLDRLRIAAERQRAGSVPKDTIGAHARSLRLLLARFFDELEPERAQRAAAAATKLIAFDIALAMDAYVGAHLEAIARHQAAIRELSTPVIEVQRGVLLLPLVGTVDTVRAEQVIEAALTRVAALGADVLITDIAGVAVVDTKVADLLLQMTKAVQLLGAESVLTGMSPLVAKTITRLGLQLDGMHTCSRLAQGLELAAQLRGARRR